MTQWAWVVVGYGLTGSAFAGWLGALARSAFRVRDRAAEVDR